MNDFERRLRDALAHEVEAAGDTEGLAAGARRRRAVRRRRMATTGAALAVGLIAVPVAVLGVGSDGSDSDPAPEQESSALEQQEVTCGQASWPVSAMDGGLSGAVDDEEVRAAFARVLQEAPMDAPGEIRDEGPEDATYIALAVGEGEYTLGTGTWSTQGPASGAQVVGLERRGDGTLRVTSWGDCDLRVAIPEGRSPVGISAPPGRVDGGVTDPVVMVREQACTSGRDPRPFLGEPQVVADDERVLVTITSESVRGGADCPGNPSVPVTLDLDEPIGDRQLLDGGTWPPMPIKVAPTETTQDADWRTVEHGGVLVDVPAGWERLSGSGCGPEITRYGPRDSDPCAVEDEGLAIYGPVDLDTKFGPGLQAEGDRWTGYVWAGGMAVEGRFDERQTALRILGSARSEGEQIPDLAKGWRTERHDGIVVDVPAAWTGGPLSTWCIGSEQQPDPATGGVQRPGDRVQLILCHPESGYGLRFEVPPGGRSDGYAWHAGPGYPDESWLATFTVRSALRGFQVITPTQALADLIVSTARVTD